MLRFVPPFRGRYIASISGGATESIASIGVAIGVTCAGIVTHDASATVAVEITTTASGQQTDQQYDRSASISVTIGATADGGLTTQTHAGTASCQVNLSVSASGFNSATTVPDETSNSNNMVMSGTAWTFVSDAAVGSRSVNLTGVTGNYGTIDESYLSLLRSPWSFSCWYKPSEGNITGNYYPTLIYTAANGTYGGSLYQMYHHGRKLRWQSVIDFSGAFTQRDTSSDVFSSGSGNDWVHIVVTLDNYGDPTIYIDGSAVTLSTDSTPNTSDISNYSNTSDIRIGQVTSNINLDYKIDDVSLWSKELSSTEVSNIYNSGNGSSLTGSSDLAGWWRMGDHSVVPITHSGTASCQVNLSASASGTVSAPFNSYAISCDGSDDYIDLNSNFSSVFNSDFSVAFWINLPDGQPTASGHGGTSTPNIFGISNSGNAHRFFSVINTPGSGDAGYVRVFYKAGGNQVEAKTASAFFPDGATGWIHVVITVEEASDGIKIYKNGSAVSVNEASSSMSTVTMSNFAGNVDMTFGASNRGGTPNYETDASFDEIAIFNAALSSSQVSTIYNSGDAYDLDGHSNLEGWWRMEEGSGTSIADSSSNSNTATLVNGPTFSSDVPFSSVYALEFDGTDDYVEVSDHNDLSFGNSSTDSAFTMAGWVKLDATSLQRFITKSGASTAEYIFGTGGGSNLLLALYDDTTSVVRYRLSSGTLSTGTWTHVAVTHSGGTIKLFINGSEDSGTSGDVGSYTAMHNSTGTVRLGAYQNSSQYTNGKLDELAIWDEALTSAEITAIYNSGAPLNLASDSGNYASSANLTAWWRLENNTNDSSGNGHNGTVNSSPTFSTDTPS